MKRKNWQDSLEEVRLFSIAENKENSVMEEIETLLRDFSEESGSELEIVIEEGDDSLSKLTERNMLGRLAKTLNLDEENKQKLFDYFEKGVLGQ